MTVGALDHSRKCSDCGQVLGCGCSAPDWHVCNLRCEDWDGSDCINSREPNHDNYSGPRGWEAEYEQAHRMEQARRLK